MSLSVPGRAVYWHASLDTTMREAARVAALGAESGTIVGAERQTEGQGRLGRAWHSPAGEGLYFTVVLRVAVPAQQLPVLTLALGLAVADSVQMFGGVTPDLRWPNDVLVNERKLAGILTVLEGGAVLAGIGVNVNQRAFPAELDGIATSLRMETGRAHDRQALLRALAASVDSWTKILATGGAGAILRHFSARSTYVEGRRVMVEPDVGTTAGLTPEGFLLLRKDGGEVVTIHAGGVRPLAE
jgi:BirA family biotin operon repressor/biotin-[acetyl-CoA-carboxylase] ligase